MASTGSVTNTLAADTVSATAIKSRDGSLTKTLANDTVSATGDLGLYGTFTKSLANDTIVATGVGPRRASLTVTLANDTAGATGKLGRIGQLTKVLANDTITSTGVKQKNAVLSAVLSNDNVSAYGSGPNKGALTTVLANDSITAGGVLGLNGLTGFLTVDLDDDSLSSTGIGQNSGVVSVTLDNDILSSTGSLEKIAQLDILLANDVLTASATAPAAGHVSVLLADDSISATGVVIIYGNLSVILDDDYSPQVVPNTVACCVPKLCQIDKTALVCSFVNQLPNGPLWQRSKRQAVANFMLREQGENPVTSCASVADHAVYAALRLYDAIRNGLWPAIRESNPYTAYTTLDDWLERYRWTDCFYGPCRDTAMGDLPFERTMDCETIFCDITAPDSLQLAIKHGIVVALTRLQLGVLSRIEDINWIISSLGAYIEVTSGASDCPVQFNIRPLSSQIPVWDIDTCEGVSSALIDASYVIPDCFEVSGSPIGLLLALTTSPITSFEIWPGILSAECIVRSILPRNQNTKINRITA